MSTQHYHISLEAFLEKHGFSFVKKSRDSLGSYTVYTNSIYTVKQYHSSNSYIYIYVNTSNSEYRSIPNLSELPSKFANHWSWDMYLLNHMS